MILGSMMSRRSGFLKWGTSKLSKAGEGPLKTAGRMVGGGRDYTWRCPKIGVPQNHPSYLARL